MLKEIINESGHNLNVYINWDAYINGSLCPIIDWESIVKNITKDTTFPIQVENRMWGEISKQTEERRNRELALFGLKLR